MGEHPWNLLQVNESDSFQGRAIASAEAEKGLTD